MVCYGKVHQGYEYPILQFAVITDTDIFGEEKKKKNFDFFNTGTKSS